jgi:hypothetical protein
MRIKAPWAFDMTMSGPEGEYTLSYAPIDGWDGEISVTIAGIEMTWPVFTVTRKNVGLCLGGMTTGTVELWNDTFWFELWPELDIPRIDYWGNQVIWRSDVGGTPLKISN